LKARLAREIVDLYYGKKEAQKAQEEFNRIFSKKEKPSKISEIKISQEKSLLLNLVMAAKLVKSKSEARRLIFQGGVKINDKVEKDWQKEISVKSGMILQVGRRKFLKIII
jgi:tyrosyl-tRNA synthetase